ncbi:MAG: hypothetical protein LBL58_19565 [Tannerellaceae bacterium]|jgi:hypothetical protein|nr:hypothetical protein [Tannerellaceae bacterium]
MEYEVNYDFLFNFLTCSPLTSRGRDSLKILRLEEEVNKEFFFNNIYVEGGFVKDDRDTAKSMYDGETVRSEEDIEKAIVRKKEFNDLITNSADSLFEINATPGSGKTTEVHHMLRKAESVFGNKTFNLIYDLEVERNEVRFGKRKFNIPIGVADKGYVHWMFFACCLDSLGDLIFKEVKGKNLGKKVIENFDRHFKNESVREMSSLEEDAIFDAISYSESESTKYINEIFDAIDGQIDRNNVENSIQFIFRITLWLLVCMNLRHMNFVVIDNIEHYIKLKSGAIIPWYDADVDKLSRWLCVCIEDAKSLSSTPRDYWVYTNCRHYIR